MTPNVYLLVDPQGWPAATTPLTPDLVGVMLQAALQSRMRLDVHTRLLGDQWFRDLQGDTRDEIVVFLLLTTPLPTTWETLVGDWLGPHHTLYSIYTDSVPRPHIRPLDSMKATQPVPRAAHRTGRPVNKGWEKPC